ncbi:cineole synthase 1, chloroplastic-like isoform X2 [Salvia miltiorrhiza]|uniref:cineole synthase 1, chloroplastic-like isoform X2 n=1 Tax=Salvia miltiorrhiza TaxID=226208 RepID=UPI0025ACEE5F|nr:cineole synthase 1, chloroplastic-like isoform X2 [Salvia miltiorrhiza]
MCSVIMPINHLHNYSHTKSSRLRCVDASSRLPRPPPCSLQLTDRHMQTGRPSGGYRPAIWDFHYIQALNSEYKLVRAAGMIAQVKKMLLQEQVVCIRRLELIDELRRLGISFHFHHEIAQIFNSNNKHTHERDLYSTALRFRLLRQHGFTVSQEVFDCFKNDKGTDFEPSLCDDTKGLVQLYEASFLSVHGEETLDLAREFATKFLQKRIVVDDEVERALEWPTHWRVQMPNATSFIDAYKRRADMNPIVLGLAKLDINIVQAQFQQELKETSRWWERLGLVKELPFVRDRIVECYYWTTGVLEHRQHGYERIMLTKINALITTIDDVFDIYATFQELQLFTTVIRRWDLESMKQLPRYMQICYLALYNFVNEMAYDTLKDKGFNSIPFLRKEWVDLIEAYLIEAKWYYKGHKPSLEEYLNNAWISIGGIPILSHLFFRLTDSIEEEAVESMHTYHDIVRASCTILRLANDLGTSLDEVERGDVPKSVECYMNEENASEREAREHLRSLIEQIWKTMNKEMMMAPDSPFSKYFLETAANLARMAQFIYQHESDGFGMQHSVINKMLRGLLFDRFD